MDFMKIIKSLEQLLYELMVWLVFYPLTMARAIFHPLRLMDYADDELDDEDEDRYSDTLSPPIFLAITLALIHVVEVAEGWNLTTEGLLADDRNLIAFRLVAFSLFPLMLSLRMLRAKGVALDRKTLRMPFYGQCFIAGPFALGIDSATLTIAGGLHLGIAWLIVIAVTAWYLAVQTLWLRSALRAGWLRSFGNAVRGFVEALAIILILNVLVELLG
ncbi:hypothetical protein [Paraurantiacibacter namhicola]|uniref:Yip1 domain protein n=1 Tax=Paraurantiacibacter namhicola TaxID=645517 RepID=A0A1C7DAK7_9SPHN|nr:hypothetical protein [Paraurantiacibacter namhicola]ANU08529.1 hypothetical protein A6F65_02246 [Paraurantiacibacter namhicola]